MDEDLKLLKKLKDELKQVENESVNTIINILPAFKQFIDSNVNCVNRNDENINNIIKDIYKNM